ncbi:hypothetical protein GCM10009869_19420 [Amnibacterium kyonggiense]
MDGVGGGAGRGTAAAVDPWAVLPDSVRILRREDGARFARVAARIWIGGDRSIPELMIQRLDAEPRVGAGDHHADLRGLDLESLAWALEAAAVAGMDARWRLTVDAVERWRFSDEELVGLPLAPNAQPDPDPVFDALAKVAEEQHFSNRADVRRVNAAVAAWRIARTEEDPGAANTPYQNGFFQDLGLQLGVAGMTAKSLVHTAERIERDLPGIWARFLEAAHPWRAMQHVRTAIEDLRDDVLPRFDEAAVDLLATTPVPKLPDALRRLAERLQARTADDRHDAAMRRRSVTIDPAADGMGWLHAYLPMEALAGLDHQLTKAAIAARRSADAPVGIGALRADILQDGLIDALSRDETRSDALVPARRGVKARVTVTIPAMSVLGHSTAPATLLGYGPIGLRTAARLAGEATCWVRVLTDPFTGAALDLGRRSYRPTADMRAMLRVLDGGGRGPGCPRGPEDVEVDHNRPFNQDGERGGTRIDNLMLLSRFDHDLKTAGETQVKLLRDRTGIFTTRAGNRYVTRPPDPLEPTPVPPELVDPDDCPF